MRKGMLSGYQGFEKIAEERKEKETKEKETKEKETKCKCFKQKWPLGLWDYV